MFSTSKQNLNIWILAILVISLTLFVVACGGGSSAEPEINAPPSDTPKPTKPETPTPIPTPTVPPPPSVQERMDQAMAFFEQDEYEQAAAELEQVITLEPDNPDAHRNLGTAYLELGQATDSVAAYEKAIQLNPDFGEAYGDLAAAYLSLGNLPAGAAAGEKAIKLAPDYATAYNNLGTIYGAQGRLDEAMVQFNAAKMIDSNDPQPYYNLGYAYQLQGRMDDAIAEYQKTIEIDVDYGDAYENLGTIYAQQGQFDEAARQLQEVIRIDNRASAYKTLGMVYLSQSQSTDAAAALETYLQLAPADSPDRAEVEGWLAGLNGTAADGLARYEHTIDCQAYNPDLQLGAFSLLYPPEFEVSDCRDKPNNYVVFEYKPGTTSEFIIFLSKMNVEADADGQFVANYLADAKNLLDAQSPQLASQLDVKLVNDTPLIFKEIPFHRRDFMGEVSGATRLVRVVTIPNFETGQGLTFMALKMIDGDPEEEIAGFEDLTQTMLASVVFSPALAGNAAAGAPAPEGVMQTIFDAAQSGNFALLQDLCDLQGENDGDTQMICDLATDETNREEFMQYFAKGKISGDAKISPDGAQAEVPFLFGPDGDSEETMELINRDGQWYLFGF